MANNPDRKAFKNRIADQSQFDDVDLPFETLRLRGEGGSSGHNGMKSILVTLSSQKFPRLRIGVGRPSGRMSTANFVTQKFSKSEEEVLPFIIQNASDAISYIRKDRSGFGTIGVIDVNSKVDPKEIFGILGYHLGRITNHQEPTTREFRAVASQLKVIGTIAEIIIDRPITICG